MNSTIVEKIAAFEAGEITDYDDIINFFQTLIDCDIIYSLQGSYQRYAQMLLDEGLIVLKQNTH